MLTPQQALNVLDQMAYRAMGNGADHAARIEALAILTPLVAEPPEDEPAADLVP